MPSSPDQTLVLGIDGGGTSTRVLLLSADGRTCGVGRAGPSNPNQVGESGLRAAVALAAREAWKDAGVQPAPLAAAFAGMAGAHSFGLEATSGALRRALGDCLPDRFEVDHDLRVALAGALSGKPGICVIAGTGSAAYGRLPDGRTARSGGWGPLVDDVGGGYWLGVRAFRAAIEELDGRGEPTRLTPEVHHFFGSSSPAELRLRLQDPGLTRTRIAEFAPRVSTLAADDDTRAKRILQCGARELARLAASVAAHLGADQPLPVVFTGGLASDALYRALFAAELATAGALSLQASEHAPVVGAAWLAFTLAGCPVDPGALRVAEARLSPAPFPP